MRPLRVLLATDSLADPHGGAAYVRDVAVGLLARGHQPVVYTLQIDEAAETLRRANVPVTDRLDALGMTPDLIQGHHSLETMTALLHFPEASAVFVCPSCQ